jgi:ABC-2 type transport system permease protein
VSLFRAGAFLVTASARNRVRLAIRKLREPRYLVGAAALGLYLWSLVGRNAFRGKPDPDLVAMQQVGGLLRLWMELGFGALGAIIVFTAWTLGADRLSFSFTEAEATWLLSGPLSRRDIVRYKVAVGLLRTLLSALLATLVFRRGLAAASTPLVLGAWLTFSLLWLNGAAASLSRIRWKQAGVALSHRVLVGGVLLGVFVLAVVLALRDAGPPPALGEDFKSTFTGSLPQFLTVFSASAPLRWLLVPPQAVAGAFFAKSLAQGLQPLVVLFLLNAVLLGYVLLLDVPLEEAALASAERRARLEARKRRRGVPLPRVRGTLRLKGVGRPEVALAWKNWLALRRVYGARLGMIVVFMGLGFGSSVWGVMQKKGGGAPDWRLVAASLSAGIACLTVLLGPLLLRTDLRADLRRLDMLRTLPLSGVQVVRGELLAPALLLVATELALLVLAFGLSAGTHLAGFPLTTRLAFTAGAFLLLPAATSAMLVVQNAAALVFPSLLVDDEERAPRGVEAAGTRLLNLAASLLLLLVGFLPGALLGLAVGGAAYWLGLGALAYTLGCAVAAGVLALEILIALRFMGRGLERLDPTTA